MAKFVGKTFESLNSMLSNSGFFTNLQEKTSAKILPNIVDSKSFIRKLKEASSEKVKEDVVQSYLSAVQKRLSDPDVPNAEISEMIQMCMTCKALGYSAPFIFIHCLKLAQKGNGGEKHTGYIAASYFLNPNHELILLLINTIQKDLCSSNYKEVELALSAVCSLINAETVHNIVHLVEEKLHHERSSVRKLAIFTLAHCLDLLDSQSAFQMCVPKLEKVMADNELDVVFAAVSLMYKIVQKLPCDFSYLLQSLADLQEQILLRRVPRTMVYCDVPAPYLQLYILRLLNHLCKDSEHREIVTPILKKTLHQVGLHNMVAHAIVFQAIETITSVQPSNELVEVVLSSVSGFLKSKNINLKLTGIEALILVVKRLKPTLTVAQQEIVMECLKLPDETLQIKTLELLFNLANSSNVQAICKKLMEFIASSTNIDRRKELASKILHLALKFTDQQDWFISTTLSVSQETGSILPVACIYSIVDAILKDEKLKALAKAKCIQLCKNKVKLTPSTVKLTASVLTSTSEFEECLPFLLEINNEESTTWTLISLMEVILKDKDVSPALLCILKDLDGKFGSSSEHLKQLLFICENLSSLKDFNSDSTIDPSLLCLDSFVVASLENGASCYLPESFRLPPTVLETITNDLPAEDLNCSEISIAEDSANSQLKSPSYSEFSSPSTSFQSLSYDRDVQLPNTTPFKNVWTTEGRKKVKSQNTLFDPDKSTDEASGDMRDLFAGIS